jgi:hypothetical protein
MVVVARLVKPPQCVEASVPDLRIFTAEPLRDFLEYLEEILPRKLLELGAGTGDAVHVVANHSILSQFAEPYLYEVGDIVYLARGDI